MSLQLNRIDNLAGLRRVHALIVNKSSLWSLLVVLNALLVLSAAETVPASSAATEQSLQDAAGSPGPLNARQLYAPRSSKRGLSVVSDVSNSDLDKLLNGTSDITWYYNYSPNSNPYLRQNYPHLEYVPQLWGGGNSADNFLSTVKSQLSSGANITSVLSFNEPDICDYGGSCVTPNDAATLWKSQLAPLQQSPYNLLVGSPAVTGTEGGFTWLGEWFSACGGECKPDFVSVHWYGDFQGLASQIGQSNATYVTNVTHGMWVTEFAQNNASLSDTQSFYNMSTEYMDRTDYIDRYAYFGAFRSSVSNVGPNVAMLNQNGELTNIGSWYLGGKATNVIPGAKSAASTTGVSSLSLLLLVAVLSCFASSTSLGLA